MTCQHRKRIPGPRVEARWGTFPTEVCVKCGRWRIIAGRKRAWQPKAALTAKEVA